MTKPQASDDRDHDPRRRESTVRRTSPRTTARVSRRRADRIRERSATRRGETNHEATTGRRSNRFPAQPAAQRKPARTTAQPTLQSAASQPAIQRLADRQPAGRQELAKPASWIDVIRPMSSYAAAHKAIRSFDGSAHGDPATALAKYRELRRLVAVKDCPHPRAAIDLVIALLPKGAPVSRKDVHALIGGGLNANQEAFHTICIACGQIPRQMRNIERVTKNPLADELVARLGPIPRTALDNEAGSAFLPPDLRLCLNIAKFKDLRTRMTAGLVLYIDAANGRDKASQQVVVTAYSAVAGAVAGIDDDESEARINAIAGVLKNNRRNLATRDKYRRRWLAAEQRIADHLASYGGLKTRFETYRIIFPACAASSVMPKLKPDADAKLMARIESYVAKAEGDPAFILARYRALRATLRLKSYAHPQRVIDLAAEVMGAKGFAKKTLHLLIGGGKEQLAHVYADLVKRFNLMPHANTSVAYQPDDPLGPWLIERLGPLPETALDPLYATMIAAPSLRSTIRIFALKVPAVRLLAGTSLYLSAGRLLRRRFYHDASAFRLFDEKLIEVGAAADPDSADAQTDPGSVQPVSIQLVAAALRALLADETISAYRRVQTMTQIVGHIARLDRLCAAHPQLQDRYRPWRISVPVSILKPLKKRVSDVAGHERIQRRDETCAPTAMDPGAIYRTLETRFCEVANIRQAFDEQCRLLEEGKNAFDHGSARFSVTLPSTLADGSLKAGEITLDFAIVTPRSLARRCSATEAALGEGQEDALLLEYLGPRNPGDRLKLARDGSAPTGACEPPILAMYRAGCFLAASHLPPALLAERSALLPPASWPQSHVATQQYRYVDKFRTTLARKCLNEGIVLLPIHELHFALGVGRALARSVLRGARIGEAMQQLADPQAFTPGAANGENIWQYHAIAKQRTVPEVFYLSARDMEAVMDVMRISGRNGWTAGPVKPAPSLRAKCGPATYLYQRGGFSMDASELNMTLALPLWPHSQRTHDLRHGIARHHHHNGMSRPTIAAFLHHSSPDTTPVGPAKWSMPVDGYIRPVAAMMSELLNLLDIYYSKEKEA